MRAKLAVFLFGLTLGMWLDAALVELNSTVTVYEWIVEPSVDFNHDVIDEALEDVDEEVDPLEGVPDEDWYNKALERFRSA